MSTDSYKIYLDNLPRYGLAVVFVWFAVDKFLLHEFYVNWLSATERVKILLPIQDLSLSIYTIGIAELVLGILLFTGLKIRWISFIVSIWLVLILSSAQYPSSFPQDLGFLGISVFLILSISTSKNKYTEKFPSYLWLVRYSIATVFFLWAIDYLLNYNRHIGWMALFSPIGKNLSANELLYLIIFIAVLEVIMGILMVLLNRTGLKYAFGAVTIFLISTLLVLAPPSSNHQSIGLALTSAWVAYLGLSKIKQ